MVVEGERSWIELRPSQDGSFDELVARDVDLVHIEMMDSGQLWLRLDKGADAQVVVATAVKRGKLDVMTEHNAMPEKHHA